MTELTGLIRPGTRRGLDFVIIEELRKRTGIMPDEILKFAMAEMLCNSLDTDATKISVTINRSDLFDEVIVEDNSTTMLTQRDIEMILDFENKASSKRGFLRVSRGYLGNALKCIFGYSHALAVENDIEPPSIEITNKGLHYEIQLRPDRVRETINTNIVTSESKDNSNTVFRVRFPTVEQIDFNRLSDILFATSMVNPDRQITYFINGEQGVLGTPAEKATIIRNESSLLWYQPQQFVSLFNDFIRARPDTQLKEFISLFRGMTGKKKIGEILQKMSVSNHDSGNAQGMQFLPTTRIVDVPQKKIETLFYIMRDETKPIGKRSVAAVLGCVGEEAFENVRANNEWAKLRYTMISAFREYGGFKRENIPNSVYERAVFPYLIELVVFDRKEDNEGLKVFQCVNFMASMEDIFSRIFNINYRLGQVGISQHTPVTVLLHLVCPVLNWLNYGKSGIDD